MPSKRFYEAIKGCAVPNFQLGVGLDKQTFYLETVVGNSVTSREDISKSFKRAVVHFASEESVFEVDGMKFKVTCERIE